MGFSIGSAFNSAFGPSTPPSAPGTVQSQGAIANFGLLELGKVANAGYQAIHWRVPATTAVQGMVHDVFHPGAFWSSLKGLGGTMMEAGEASGVVNVVMSAIYNGYNVFKGNESVGKAVREVAFDGAAGVGGGMTAALFSGIGGALLGCLFSGPLLFLGAAAFGIAGYMLGANTVKATLYSLWDHFTTRMNGGSSSGQASSSSASSSSSSNAPLVPSTSGSTSTPSPPPPTLAPPVSGAPLSQPA